MSSDVASGTVGYTARTMKRHIAIVVCVLIVSGTSAQSRRPVTVDDLMKLRAIVDVRISPDGEHVAYVTSVPSLPTNEHDGALFVVPATGG